MHATGTGEDLGLADIDLEGIADDRAVLRKLERWLEASRREDANVGEIERVISMVGGGALIVYGLTRRSVSGALLAAVGAGLVYRGKGGHCPVYQQMGVTTATGQGVELELDQAITVNRSIEDVYTFYRN